MSVCVHVCCVCACPWRPVKGVRNWSYRGVLAAGYGAGSRTAVLWRNRDYSHPWALSLAPAWYLLPGGGTNLGGRDLRMGWTKGKSNPGANFIQRIRQFVPRRLRKTIWVRFSWVQAVYGHSQRQTARGKSMSFPRGTRITTAKVNSLLSTTPGRSTAPHSKT